jgi:hypothetical protein
MPEVSVRCPTVSVQRLIDFVQGKLPHAEADTIAKHLEHCPICLGAIGKVPGDSFFNLVKSARPSDPQHSRTQLPGGPAPVQADPPVLPPELATHPRYRILRGSWGAAAWVSFTRRARR